MTLWSSEAQDGDISRSGVQIPPTPFPAASNTASGRNIDEVDLNLGSRSANAVSDRLPPVRYLRRPIFTPLLDDERQRGECDIYLGPPLPRCDSRRESERASARRFGHLVRTRTAQSAGEPR